MSDVNLKPWMTEYKKKENAHNIGEYNCFNRAMSGHLTVRVSAPPSWFKLMVCDRLISHLPHQTSALMVVYGNTSRSDPFDVSCRNRQVN